MLHKTCKKTNAQLICSMLHFDYMKMVDDTYVTFYAISTVDIGLFLRHTLTSLYIQHLLLNLVGAFEANPSRFVLAL